mgnify:CR=1 FL=1
MNLKFTVAKAKSNDRIHVQPVNMGETGEAFAKIVHEGCFNRSRITGLHTYDIFDNQQFLKSQKA